MYFAGEPLSFCVDLFEYRYHMHHAVYWLAADPYDMEPEVWRPHITKYAWVCQANGRHAPEDSSGRKQYVADYREVDSIKHCEIVGRHWDNPKMLDAATRTTIDKFNTEWLEA